METCIDFVRLLELDMVLKILMCVHDPGDLIRASAVSKYWRNFVLSYGLCKQLCIKLFPQLACIAQVGEVVFNDHRDFSKDKFHRVHKAYGSLFHAITSFLESRSFIYSISASSTDNYPEQSIIETLNPRDQNHLDRLSYWSSKGHKDPQVPEFLIYKVNDRFDSLYAILEINIRPFQAFFQAGSPIYSARYVRFRMGHPKFYSYNNFKLDSQESADDKIVWTYTSHTFPMIQENRLQKFKFSEPVLCIGGFLKIELLDRVQKQATDDKYYIRVAHVEAVGRQLSAFSVDFSNLPNSIFLRYNAQEFRQHRN